MLGRVIFLTNFKSGDDLIKALDPPAAVDALTGRAGAHLAPLGLGLVALRLHLRLERGLEDVAHLNMVVMSDNDLVDATDEESDNNDNGEDVADQGRGDRLNVSLWLRSVSGHSVASSWSSWLP